MPTTAPTAPESGKPQSGKRPPWEPWHLLQERELGQREVVSELTRAAFPKLPVLPNHGGELLRSTNSWMVSPEIRVLWVWNGACVVLKGGPVYSPQDHWRLSSSKSSHKDWEKTLMTVEQTTLNHCKQRGEATGVPGPQGPKPQKALRPHCP